MSLKEQMLQAGLITEKQAKQTTHKERVSTKTDGRSAKQREQEVARKDVQRQQQAARTQDQQRNAQKRATETQVAQGHQDKQKRQSVIQAAYREGALSRWSGNRRYYFVVGTRIDALQVSDEVARKLEAGQAAIAKPEKNSGTPTVLSASAARSLREVAPERVLTFHGE